MLNSETKTLCFKNSLNSYSYSFAPEAMYFFDIHSVLVSALLWPISPYIRFCSIAAPPPSPFPNPLGINIGVTHIQKETSDHLHNIHVLSLLRTHGTAPEKET